MKTLKISLDEVHADITVESMLFNNVNADEAIRDITLMIIDSLKINSPKTTN